MRITQRAVALTSLQGLNRNLDAVGRLQQQLTSGRLISAPSDSPTGTNRAMQTRSDQAASAQQQRDVSAQAIATEVKSLREGLLSLANRTIGGRPLFGGVTPGSKAYDATGAYVGQAGPPVTRRVSDTEVVRVDTPGPQAFGPAGADIFAIADKIATDVVANPAALAGHLADLDAVMKGMLTAVADVGA